MVVDEAGDLFQLALVGHVDEHASDLSGISSEHNDVALAPSPLLLGIG